MAGKESKELYEVQNLDSEEVIGSWTLGKDRVGGRTSLIITSRTDPVFIILPLLKSHAEAKGNVPLDDLISSQVSLLYCVRTRRKIPTLKLFSQY